MKTVLSLFCVALLAALLAGCGGEKDRGRNRDKDKPHAADKEK